MSDEDDLRRLIAHHGHLRDDQNWERWEPYFAEDAIFSMAGTNTIGRDKIRAAQQARAEAGPAGKHLLGPTVVSVQGDKAEAQTDSIYVALTAEGTFSILVVCRYCDVWARTGPDGGWQIQRRDVKYVGA
jgi:SnoaL-like domain